MSPQSALPESRAEEIVDTAAELFARHGLDGVSINAIATAAGTSKANVFHHFGNKNALYMAVLRRITRRLRELLRELASDAQDTTARLSHFAHAHIHGLLDQREIWSLVLRETVDTAPDDERRALTSQALSENFSLLTAIIRDGQHQGALRSDRDPALIGTLLVAANVFFFLSREMMAQHPEVGFADDPAGYTDMVLEIVLDGVRVPDGPG